MVKTTEYFWTDAEQARERLTSCVILYDDSPVYVNEVRDDYDDGIPRLIITPCLPTGERTTKKANSPSFKRFRESPKIGWCNYASRPVFFQRNSRRATKHGLHNGNVSVFCKGGSSDEYNFTPVERNFSNYLFDNSGFIDMHNGTYPSLNKILQNIQEGTGIAYSRRFLVYRDKLGIKWLYRDLERIGLFTGTDTLNLLRQFAFYREEIMEDSAFTVDKIQEF